MVMMMMMMLGCPPSLCAVHAWLLHQYSGAGYVLFPSFSQFGVFAVRFCFDWNAFGLFSPHHREATDWCTRGIIIDGWFGFENLCEQFGRVQHTQLFSIFFGGSESRTIYIIWNSNKSKSMAINWEIHSQSTRCMYGQHAPTIAVQPAKLHRFLLSYINRKLCSQMCSVPSSHTAISSTPVRNVFVCVSVSNSNGIIMCWMCRRIDLGSAPPSTSTTTMATQKRWCSFPTVDVGWCDSEVKII